MFHDFAISVQSSSVGPSAVYSALGPLSPIRMSAYNPFAASTLLNQQYAAALGLGKSIKSSAHTTCRGIICLHLLSNVLVVCVCVGHVLPGLHVRRGPMVEKAVQTLHVERSWPRRELTTPQEKDQRWDRRRAPGVRGQTSQSRRVIGAGGKA